MLIWRSYLRSELQHRPQAKHRRIFQRLSRIDAERIGGAAARMHDVLKVRLQGPAGTNLVLINRRHQRLETAGRPARSHHLLEVGVERLRARRNMGISEGDTELVLWPDIAQADEFDAAIGIAIDQVPVRRAHGDAGEYADSPVEIVADAIEPLFEYRIDP